MEECIRREAAIEILNIAYPLGMDEAAYDTMHSMISKLPAADVVEVRHGKWIKHNDRSCWYCSECNTDNYYAYTWDCDTGGFKFQDNYCPNCGAKMGDEDVQV